MKIVVIGAGKVGYNISKALSDEQHDVIVIDKDPEVLNMVSDRLDVMTVVGNGASAKILEAIDIKTVDIIVAVTENDELNMIACMTAKQCGVPMTVARIRNSDYTSPHPYVLSYSKYGIDLIINPEHLAAQEIFRLIEVPMATDMEYFFDGKLSLIGLKIEEDMAVAGKSISELNLNNFTIVAISRNGKAVIPHGSTVLTPNDKVFVLGESKGFHNLNGLIKLKKHSFRRIIIAGSNLTAQYLVRLLIGKKNTPELTMIDTNRERLQTLAQEMNGCDFIYADPTKLEILTEENLGPGDIFISLLGSENANLVASMMANKLGVKEIISEIGREDNIPLAERAGVTATITPRLLTVNTVLKLVRAKNIVAISLLDSGDAEIMELIVEEDSPVTRGRLKDLNIPSGILIGAAIHQGDIVVPRGDTLLCANDHVIVFALQSAVARAEKLFIRSADLMEESL